MLDFSKEIKVVYCCPSYKRPFCRTARYIKETNIYIDVSEKEVYEEANKGYGNIVVCDDGIQGNLPRVRNYMLDKEFENGADVVVMMDDDVECLGWFSVDENSNYGYVKHKIKPKDVNDFILYGSVLCEEWGFGMWGCNHTSDPVVYRHCSPFSTHSGCVGQFMVFTKNKLRFDETLPLKEDYDMSIQQNNKYRGVLMFNFAFVKGDFGKLSGGTAIRRNSKRELEQFVLFKKKWGSDIVIGADVKQGNQRGGNKKASYDFSHPNVKIPIKGI